MTLHIMGLKASSPDTGDDLPAVVQLKAEM